jgi:hypothetical protein
MLCINLGTKENDRVSLWLHLYVVVKETQGFLMQQNQDKVLVSGRHSPSYPVNSSSNQTNGNRNVNYSSRPTVVNSQEPVPNSDEFPPMAALVRGGQGNIRVLNAAESRNSFGPGQLSSLYPVNSSLNQINGNRNVNYSSRPTVVNSQEPVPNSDEFPPILGRHHVPVASATENQGQGPSNAPLLSEEMRAANKALVESIDQVWEAMSNNLQHLKISLLSFEMVILVLESIIHIYQSGVCHILYLGLQVYVLTKTNKENC